MGNATEQSSKPAPAGTASTGWSLTSAERRWVALSICLVIVFGAILEKRTALRRVPMTDLGVFSCASWAAWHGGDIYSVSDWNGWHYQYPPTLAILFAPLSHPLPIISPGAAAQDGLSQTNTPWGYRLRNQSSFYGLDRQNLRFFWIVLAWYLISIFLVLGSCHLLASVLEGRKWRDPPPAESAARRRWWWLRWVPLLLCITSFGTELSRGQVDVLMLAAISLALYLTAAGRDTSAGLALSFPATVKLFPPLILIYPLWRQKWRMFLGVVVGLILALIILPAVALGPARTLELYQTWGQVLAKPALGHGTDSSRAKELTGMTATDNQSLLAFVHNWRYRDLPRKARPPEAAPWERYTVYAVGVLMLAALGVVAGRRRSDAPRSFLLVTGLLIGLSFVLSPIVHNFYYLVLLPLLAALVDEVLHQPPGAKPPSRLWLPLVVFMVVDIFARLPGIGPILRDLGAPLLSMVWLLWVGGALLWRSHSVETSVAPAPPQTSWPVT